MLRLFRVGYRVRPGPEVKNYESWEFLAGVPSALKQYWGWILAL